MSKKAKAYWMLFGMSLVMGSCTAELMTTRVVSKGPFVQSR